VIAQNVGILRVTADIWVTTLYVGLAKTVFTMMETSATQ